MAHRDVMGSAFSARELPSDEDLNPMGGLSNLADAMLVFACGLLLALIVQYDVALSPEMSEVIESDELVDLKGDVEEGQSTLSPEGAGYQELGVVYVDPATGKKYMLASDLSE